MDPEEEEEEEEEDEEDEEGFPTSPSSPPKTRTASVHAQRPVWLLVALALDRFGSWYDLVSARSVARSAFTHDVYTTRDVYTTKAPVG